MKIGLFTIYQVPNYGSVLQAYATQCVLEQMGCVCRIINYNYPNEWHYNQGTPRPNKLKSIIRYLFPSAKKRVLDTFRNDFLKLTRRYAGLKDLSNEDWSSYDGFVVGSDQVWNARFLKGDKAFMLSFVPDNKPRYSISSSFALQKIPEYLIDKYRRELSKFKALSVREINGVNIIQQQLNIAKQVEVILDPTLLLSKDEWLKLIPRSKFKKECPYILLYMWAYAFEPRPYIFQLVKYFQSLMKCDVIALEGYTPAEKADGLMMKNASASSISEFIDLFNNADLVVTSSFHGTSFAVNFGIPLISIVPDYDGDDRQSTLLKNLNIGNLITKVNTPFHLVNYTYDENVVQGKLKDLRSISLSWIQNNVVMPSI